MIEELIKETQKQNTKSLLILKLLIDNELRNRRLIETLTDLIRTEE